MYKKTTRKEWSSKGMNHVVARPDVAGKCTIYNPTIDRVERGMMIRFWVGSRSEKTEGEIVLDINSEDQTVLVSCCTGGTKEYHVWVSIDRVHCCWDIGGYDYAMSLLNAFTTKLLST